MKWTTERPKKKGYYWVKYDDFWKYCDDPDEPDVIYLDFDEGEASAWPVQWDTDNYVIEHIILWSDESIPYPDEKA